MTTRKRKPNRRALRGAVVLLSHPPQGILGKRLTVSEFNEFDPRLKSAKNRFQLSTSLNLEKLNAILSGTNHI